MERIPGMEKSMPKQNVTDGTFPEYHFELRTWICNQSMITSQRGTSSDMLSMDRQLHVSTKKGQHAKWRCLCQYQLAPYGIAYSSRWDVTILIIFWSYLIFACQRRTPPTFNSLKKYYPFFRNKKTKTYPSRVGPILLKPPTTIQLGEGLFFLRCNHGFEGTDVCLHASGREVSWFQLQKIISVTHTICLIPHGYITLQA